LPFNPLSLKKLLLRVISLTKLPKNYIYIYILVWDNDKSLHLWVEWNIQQYTFWLIIILNPHVHCANHERQYFIGWTNLTPIKIFMKFLFFKQINCPKFWTSIIESGGNLKLESQHYIQDANHKLWTEIGGLAIDVSKKKTHNSSLNTLMCLYGACLWWLLEMVTMEHNKGHNYTNMYLCVWNSPPKNICENNIHSKLKILENNILDVEVDYIK
jgi:hypothetical protein